MIHDALVWRSCFLNIYTRKRDKKTTLNFHAQPIPPFNYLTSSWEFWELRQLLWTGWMNVKKKHDLPIIDDVS